MSDFTLVLKCLFSNVWNLLVSVKFPGIGVSIAAIMIGVFLIGLAIRIFAFMFGFLSSDKPNK